MKNLSSSQAIADGRSDCRRYIAHSCQSMAAIDFPARPDRFPVPGTRAGKNNLFTFGEVFDQNAEEVLKFQRAEHTCWLGTSFIKPNHIVKPTESACVPRQGEI